MLVEIPNVLNATQLAAIRSVLQRCRYVDGIMSAGDNAARSKLNREVDSSSEQYHALNDVVMTSLVRHPVYLNAGLPLKTAAPIYARYTRGMHYGAHFDDPVMGSNPRYRADISITVFLSEPESYDGGDLCIETDFGEKRIKLPAGYAVMYPSSSRHSVATVTEGERLVAVTWVQSMVRDPEQRRILFNLCKVRERLTTSAGSDEYALLDESYTNLVRMWSEV